MSRNAAPKSNALEAIRKIHEASQTRIDPARMFPDFHIGQQVFIGIEPSEASLARTITAITFMEKDLSDPMNILEHPLTVVETNEGSLMVHHRDSGEVSFMRFVHPAGEVLATSILYVQS